MSCKPTFCQSCPINHVTEGYVYPQLTNSNQLIVGEVASADDIEYNKPLVGGAGRWLTSLLKYSRQNRDQFNIITTIGCKTPDGMFPGDSNWKCTSTEDGKAAVNHCRQHHLEPVLSSRDWNKIIALGEGALKATTGRSGITAWRGSPLPLLGHLDKPRVIPTLAPAVLMKGSNLFPVIAGDLRKSTNLPPENYNLYASVDDFKNFKHKRFVFDFEWDEWGNVTLCGICGEPYKVLVCNFIEPYISVLKTLFEEATELYGHNIISADSRYFERWGWDIKAQLWDTMLMQHLVQPDYRHGLGFVVSVFTNRVHWKGMGEEDVDNEDGVEKVSKAQWKTWRREDAIPISLGGYGGCSSDDEAFRLYNARDNAGNYDIIDPLETLLDRYDLRKIYWNVSRPVAEICRNMGDYGFKIDQNRLTLMIDEIDRDIIRLEKELPDGLRPYDEEVAKRVPAPPDTYKPAKRICKGSKKNKNSHEPVEILFDKPDTVINCPVCETPVNSPKLSLVKTMAGTAMEHITPWNSTDQVIEYAKKQGLRLVFNFKTKQLTADKNARKAWGKHETAFVTIDKLKKLATLRNGFTKDGLRTTDRMYFNILTHGTSEGRLSSTAGRKGIDINIQNCFDGNTELLTKDGWVKFKDYDLKSRVAQVNQFTKEISFTEITGHVRQWFTGNLLNIKTEEQIDLLVTPDHECLLYNANNCSRDKHDPIPFKVKAKDFPNNNKVQLQAGYCKTLGATYYTTNQLILIASLQADGHITKYNIDWTFQKERKVARLRAALDELGIEYHYHFNTTKKRHRVTVPHRPDTEWLQSWKFFDKRILELTADSMLVLANELWHWDGCFTRRSMYSSSVKTNVDWAQILCILSRRRAKIREYNREGNNTNWQIDVSNTDGSSINNREIIPVPYNDYVYCVTVPEGNIIVRRNGRVAITGNCPKKARKIFIPDTPDHCLLSFDISQGENIITTWLAEDHERWERIIDPTYDEHSALASRIFNCDCTKDGPNDALRQIGKKINHGRNYGMGIRKQLEILVAEGFSMYTERDVREFIEIWKQMNKGTAIWQDQVIELARTQGYLRNAFGRIRWFNTADLATKALAFLPASTLADCVLRMMIAMHHTKYMSEIQALGLERAIDLPDDWSLRIQVHDDLTSHGPVATMAEAAHKIKYVMTQPWKELRGLVLNVDGKYSTKSWGELEPLPPNI